MARKKSEFLSAFGTVMEIWKLIVEAVLTLGGTDDDLRRVVTEKGLAMKIAQLIMASAKPAAKAVAQVATAVTKEVDAVFKVVVEYIQPGYEALRAAFDWVNSDYQVARFEPIEQCKDVLRGTREVVFQYVHMARDASTEAVLAEMARLGLRPALYEELLVFAKQNPNEQRQFPIVVLGSVWVDPDGYRYVAGLYRDGSGRNLRLFWYDSGWDGYCRFLAVAVSK